jgi:uncharacterized membrane protein
MNNINKKVAGLFYGYNRIGLIFSIVIIFCILFFTYIFFNYLNTSPTYVCQPRIDEELMAQIEKLDSVSKAKDLNELSEELHQMRKLTKYVVERESKYQMEIDLIIDKYSQWTGYWLSIISCVLALFTLIQAFINYRTNQENTEKSEKSSEKCENAIKEVEEAMKKFRDDANELLKNNAKDIEKTKQNLKLSIYQNKMSCITACLSSFPDAFSLKPNDERQQFIRNFMRMLNEEYSEFTNYIGNLVAYNNGPEGGLITRKEVNNVYLIWCDIGVAVNQIMFDFSGTEQSVAFSHLRDLLSTTIREMHEQSINSANVHQKMLDIQQDIDRLVNLL